MKTIPLTKGYFAKVDDGDYTKLAFFRWHATVSAGWVRARRFDYSTGKKVGVYMHREVVGAPRGVQVDHINGDGLDNRRKNLRLCSNKENCQNQRAGRNNTSGYKGVSWHKHAKKWSASIGIDGKTKYIGYFDSKEEAALAYNESALQHFGEFARLNKV